MNNTEIKYFTPQEANNTLPLVKKIVKDILEKGFLLKTIQDSVDGDISENSEAKALVEEIQYFMDELQEIGCYYKDWNFAIGLVDFPAIINEEEVFLCWRSDEENISFYHNMQDGYSGRKEIPEKYFELS